MTQLPHGVRSPEGLDGIARVRNFVAALDEVVEAVDKFGHTSFRVRDKPFVMFGEGNEGVSLSVKADLDTQQHLIGHLGFYRTPYIGQHGWTSLRLPTEIWGEVEELVLDAYILTAPKKLADAARGARDQR